MSKKIPWACASVCTGTASDTDWACHGNEKTFSSYREYGGSYMLECKKNSAFRPQHRDYMLECFSDRRQTAIVLGTYREALSQRIPWAQVRLQKQFENAKATIFLDNTEVATGFVTSKKTKPLLIHRHYQNKTKDVSLYNATIAKFKCHQA